MNDQAQTSPWLYALFRPLVLAAMVGCVVTSVVGLIQLFFPDLSVIYLVASCVLVALEASYSFRLLRRSRALRSNALQFRLVEMVTVFVLLKAGSFIGAGWASVAAEIRAWPRDWLSILDPNTGLALMWAFFSWYVVTLTLYDLERIGEPPDPHPSYVPPLESLSTRFFGGGVILLLAAGMSRVPLFEILNLGRPSIPGLVLNALVYFLLGLVMLGQVRLNILKKGWRTQELTVDRNLPQRWVCYSLAFIGLAALAAFVLPTGYSVGLLETMGWIVSLLAQILLALAWLLLTLLTLPLQLFLWLISRLFGGDQPPPEITPPQLEPPVPARSGSGPTWLALLRSLLFWAVLLIGMLYVMRSYLRTHSELWEALAMRRSIRALRRGWVALWRWLKTRILRLGRAVNERLSRRLPQRSARDEPAPGVLRFFRLGALSPRERVLYYYLSVLRRADKQGYPRRGHQTPQEYRLTLEPELSEAQPELAALTQAFEEARYSQHTVEPEQDRQVRTHWKRVKAALRALKQA